MKQRFLASTLLATAMTIAGAAMAQGTTTDKPAAPDPAVGGQASTKPKVPMGNTANPTQVPDGSNPASREAVRSEARMQNKNNANSMVSKGEASTTVNAQPNAMPQPTGEMSRNQVSQTARKTKPQFGEKGERPEVPTNPTSSTGTPK